VIRAAFDLDVEVVELSEYFDDTTEASTAPCVVGRVSSGRNSSAARAQLSSRRSRRISTAG